MLVVVTPSIIEESSDSVVSPRAESASKSSLSNEAVESAEESAEESEEESAAAASAATELLDSAASSTTVIRSTNRPRESPSKLYGLIVLWSTAIPASANKSATAACTANSCSLVGKAVFSIIS